MIKPIIFVRDSAGKFVSKPKAMLHTIGITVAVMGVLYVLSSVALSILNWGNTHSFQKPIVVEVYKRKMFPTLPERTVLSPIVEDVMQSGESAGGSSMTATESLILKYFGERNYQVARAIFKCESGLDNEAISHTRDVGIAQINWPVWRKPVFDKFGYTLVDMFDAEKNLKVAVWVFDRDGDGAGSWEPWVTYGNGCFKAFL